MSAGLKISNIFNTGYCLTRGYFADKTLSFKLKRIYSRCFLIEHPHKGLILIDTGYGKALQDLIKKKPYSWYNKLLPFFYNPEDSIVYQLKDQGIKVKDISYLFITHYHPDHIGALDEFKDTPWIYRKDTLIQLNSFSNLRAFANGYLKPLVPNIPKYSIPINDCDFNDSYYGIRSFNLWNDPLFHLIDIPGHALGQMGIAFQDQFFVADATWGSKNLPGLPGIIIQQNPKKYFHTFKLLQDLQDTIHIYPTHLVTDHV